MESRRIPFLDSVGDPRVSALHIGYMATGSDRRQIRHTAIQQGVQMKTQPHRTTSKPYTPVSFDDSVIDVESILSGTVLCGMLGFICLLFVGCFDAGLFA